MKEVFNKIKTQIKETKDITKSVKYPDKLTIAKNTIMVIISMFIVSAVIFMVDSSITEIYNLIF